MPASSARGPTRTAAHWWWWWQGEGQLENTYKRVIEDVKLALFRAQKFPSGTSNILSLNKEVATTKTLRERNSEITETGFRYKISTKRARNNSLYLDVRNDQIQYQGTEINILSKKRSPTLSQTGRKNHYLLTTTISSNSSLFPNVSIETLNSWDKNHSKNTLDLRLMTINREITLFSLLFTIEE